MDTRESIIGLLESVSPSDVECRASGLHYFNKSLQDFIDNPSVANAEKVYLFFSGLYQLSDENEAPLANMMDLMHSYEENVSRFTEKHRDHYIHSINVFLLGVEIFQNCSKVRVIFESCYGTGSFSTLSGLFLFIWGNSALFHDVGYPIEIASNQAKSFVRQICRANGNVKNVKIGIKIDSELDVEDIDLCRWGEKSGNVCDLLSDGINKNMDNSVEFVHDLVSNYMRNMFEGRFVDHGFFSAVMLMRTYAESLQSAGRSSERFYTDVVTAASAIFMHNMYPYNLAKNPLFGPLKIEMHPAGFLLMLCDGLQEWNRKGYGSCNEDTFFLKSCGAIISESFLRINYITCDEIISHSIVKDKELEMKSILDLDDLFPNGFKISCSCDSQVDVLFKKINSGAYDNVPRPLLDSIEDIARAIHKDYNRHRLAENPDEELEYPEWDDLSQDLQYSNMSQAMDYVNKVEYLGYHIGLKGTEVSQFTPEEVEVLSIMEHNRWVEERLSNGWVFGPEKNTDLRISPYLTSWENIPESIREYDRQAVRNIIPILETAGLHVLM